MDAEELLGRYAAGERDFTGADLSGVELIDAQLPEIKLRDAQLICTDLNGANFFAARVERTNFTEANLTSAKFSVLSDVYTVTFKDTIMPNGTLQEGLKIWD